MPATCPYPEPARPTPYPHIPLPKKIHLNIILPSTPGSPKWSISLRFPHQNPAYTSSLTRTRYMSSPSLLDFITRTILGEQYRSLSFSSCSFLHSLGNSYLLDSNIPFNTLFANSLCLRSSPSVSDQVLHPYKTIGKIIFLHILIFNFFFFDSKLEGKRF